MGNGSFYRTYETRRSARLLGLKPKITGAGSPDTNDIAENFVKTMKRDYTSLMRIQQCRICRWRLSMITNGIHTVFRVYTTRMSGVTASLKYDKRCVRNHRGKPTV